MEVIEKDSQELAETIGKIKKALNDTALIAEYHRPSIMEERYYTSEEICEFFHLSKRTLQNYRDAGTIPYTKIGEKILYRDSDIDRILQESYIPEFK